jgi:hypothetical protein
MEAELSVPVIWVENGGAPRAGRADLTAVGVHLDGGSRAERRTLDLAYAEIEAVRIGRDGSDRIDGRRAVVLTLRSGREVSFVAFDRPGAVLELAHRLEERI